MLYVEDRGLGEDVSIPDFNGGPNTSPKPCTPLKALNFTIGQYISHVFEFGVYVSYEAVYLYLIPTTVQPLLETGTLVVALLFIQFRFIIFFAL
jgi:hypothetical protein